MYVCVCMYVLTYLPRHLSIHLSIKRPSVHPWAESAFILQIMFVSLIWCRKWWAGLSVWGLAFRDLSAFLHHLSFRFFLSVLPEGNVSPENTSTAHFFLAFTVPACDGEPWACDWFDCWSGWIAGWVRTATEHELIRKQPHSSISEKWNAAELQCVGSGGIVYRQDVPVLIVPVLTNYLDTSWACCGR